MRPTFLILLLVFGCTNSKQSANQTVSDTTRSTQKIEGISSDQQEKANLTDTITNGVSIRFLELTDQSFDSLRQLGKQTKLPLKSFDKKVTTLDSCVTFKLNNGQIDSLCNVDDGEYFEKYLIKGIWEAQNVLLVNFQNWEESHDFLISLINGDYYLLTPFYEASPKLDMIISYVDISAVPIYSSELILTRFKNGILTTLLERDLGQLTITDAMWISNTDCLLSTGFVDNQTDDIVNKKKYLMKVE